jgi:hypothetical protein
VATAERTTATLLYAQTDHVDLARVLEYLNSLLEKGRVSTPFDA